MRKVLACARDALDHCHHEEDGKEKRRGEKKFASFIRNSFCFNARIVLFVKEALRPERPDLLHRDANQTI